MYSNVGHLGWTPIYTSLKVSKNKEKLAFLGVGGGEAEHLPQEQNKVESALNKLEQGGDLEQINGKRGLEYQPPFSYHWFALKPSFQNGLS